MLDQRFSDSVHIMTVIAYHERLGDLREKNKSDLLTSEFLANSLRTNAALVRRLLAKLVESGLLKSFKGKAGGVRLAKPAKEISLRDIYVAVSGKKLIHTPNKEPLKVCAVSCAMKKILCNVLDGLEEQSMDYLSKIKLSELNKKV